MQHKLSEFVPACVANRMAALKQLKPAATSFCPTTCLKAHHTHKHSGMKNYKVLRNDIASGSSGKIDLAVDMRTGEKVAVKRVRITDKNAHALYREEKIHSVISQHPHPQIARLYDAFQSNEDVVFVVEYSEGGDLLDAIPPDTGLPIDTALSYAEQIFRGLAHLHSLGYAHRDVKGENCVLDESRRFLQLIDFGFAARLGDGAAASKASGTIPYIAPEVLVNVCCDLAKADVWSAGIVLYSLITGRFPWARAVTGDSEFFLYIHGTHSPGEAKRWNSFPDDVLLLLQSVLCPDPDIRCTATEAADYIMAIRMSRGA